MEINPSNMTLQQLRDHWQTVAAHLLYKLGGETTLTVDDIEQFNTMFGGDMPCLVTTGEKDDLTLKLMPYSHVKQLLKKQEGKGN